MWLDGGEGGFNMSSDRRPWYKWYPKDFVVDEKVQALSPLAELLYRRALDVMWQANDNQLPNVCFKLANQIGKGLSEDEFKKSWDEIQYPGFELFKTTEDGLWIYSKRLKVEAERIQEISQIRANAGKTGGKSKSKQMQSKCKANAKANGKQKPTDTDTDTDTDNSNIPPISPKSKSKKLTPPTLDEVKQYFSENGIDPAIGKEAFDYYEAGNWHDSQGKPVKNWKQKMRGVWFKNNSAKKVKSISDHNKQACAEAIAEMEAANGTDGF